jgi:hypothetical protein
MGKIEFNIGQGGLGRPLTGKDYYSGLLFDSAVYPSGFSALEPIKLVASLEDAEDLGIVSGTGETLATGGEIEVTLVGAAGDKYTIAIQSTRNPAITLGEVIEAAAETADTLAARIAAIINANSNTTGFTASAALAVVSIVMAPDWGAAFNGAGLSIVSTGAGTSTVTQFTAGVGSDLSALHYTVSEFFRMQPKGLLWIGIYDESGGLDSQDIEDIQTEADGDIRQMAILMQTSFATGDLGIIQTAIDALQVDYQFMNALYAADQLSDTLTALADLRALTDDRVSAVCGQDGGAEGWRLVDVLDRSMPAVGTALGTVALASVSENIGWVSKFDLAGGEMEVLSFTTGDLLKAISSPTLLFLENRGWIFGKKYVGKAGSYWNDSSCAITETSDYAYIENGRTIDKAVRGVNVALTNFINAPLFVDAQTGRLTELTISTFANAASIPLDQMLIDLDLSGFEVIIDPEQNVLATSTITITIRLVPVGVARTIVVNIGYTVSLS